MRNTFSFENQLQRKAACFSATERIIAAVLSLPSQIQRNPSRSSRSNTHALMYVVIGKRKPAHRTEGKIKGGGTRRALKHCLHKRRHGTRRRRGRAVVHLKSRKTLTFARAVYAAVRWFSPADSLSGRRVESRPVALKRQSHTLTRIQLSLRDERRTRNRLFRIRGDDN